MPRAGGVYSKPAGTTAVPNTTIESAKYNQVIDDLVTDANTPRPVVAGGTGASTAGGARTNLGLVIGTDVQAFDATLTSIAALSTAADKMLYTTGVDTWAEADITAAGRAILDDADAAAQRTTLGLGTAAEADTGTATGDVVVLEDVGGSPGLPAVDGSQLTGIANPVKAWVNFNGTGTVAIRASSNVASITDHDVGEYSVNFTTPLADANYAAVITIGLPTSDAVAVRIISQTASAIRFRLFQTGNGSRQDAEIINVIVVR